MADHDEMTGTQEWVDWQYERDVRRVVTNAVMGWIGASPGSIGLDA